MTKYNIVFKDGQTYRLNAYNLQDVFDNCKGKEIREIYQFFNKQNKYMKVYQN